MLWSYLSDPEVLLTVGLFCAAVGLVVALWRAE